MQSALLAFIKELNLRILMKGKITVLIKEDMRVTQRLQNTVL
jgi:hypothetical protein